MEIEISDRIRCRDRCFDTAIRACTSTSPIRMLFLRNTLRSTRQSQRCHSWCFLSPEDLMKGTRCPACDPRVFPHPSSHVEGDSMTALSRARYEQDWALGRVHLICARRDGHTISSSPSVNRSKFSGQGMPATSFKTNTTPMPVIAPSFVLHTPQFTLCDK